LQVNSSAERYQRELAYSPFSEMKEAANCGGLILSAPLLRSPRKFHPFFGEPQPFFSIVRTDRPLCMLEAFLRSI
jgi:hypothetical protein